MLSIKALRRRFVAWGGRVVRREAKRTTRRVLRYESLDSRQLLAAIAVGDWLVPAGETAWTIPIRATGGDRVDGINFNIQIEDGLKSPGEAGPVFTGLDIVQGTIFAGKNTGSWDHHVLDWLAWDWTDINPAETVYADGVIGYVTVNTVDCPSGTWDLVMSETLNGPTDFAGMRAAIVNGTITVSQRPIADAGGPYAVDEGATVTLDGSQSADPDGGDSLVAYEWDLDGDGDYGETGGAAARGDELGVAPTFSARLGEPGVWTVRLRVRDDHGLESVPQASWVTVADTNQAPELAAPIPDQTAPANRWFRYTFGSDTFVDLDRGQTLTYAATQADGTPLPAWLVFDAATRSFSGRPLVRDAGQFRVRVTATDSGSPGLSAWDEFSLTVTPQPFPYHNVDLPQDVDGDGGVEPQDALIVINWINAHGSGPVPDSWSEVTAEPFYFFDVYADNFILPIDVLAVINYLNGGKQVIAKLPSSAVQT